VGAMPRLDSNADTRVIAEEGGNEIDILEGVLQDPGCPTTGTHMLGRGEDVRCLKHTLIFRFQKLLRPMLRDLSSAFMSSF